VLLPDLLLHGLRQPPLPAQRRHRVPRQREDHRVDEQRGAEEHGDELEQPPPDVPDHPVVASGRQPLVTWGSSTCRFQANSTLSTASEWPPTAFSTHSGMPGRSSKRIACAWVTSSLACSTDSAALICRMRSSNSGLE